MAKGTKRLIEHRRAFKRSRGQMSMLLLDDLTRQEHDHITKQIFSEIGRRPDRNPFVIHGRILAAWGIMCPHPKNARRYNEDEKFADDWPWQSRRYVCQACGSNAIREEITTVRKKVAAGGAS